MRQAHHLNAVSISVGYDHKIVLHDLSFSAYPGELTVLVGPNGCGKSTLLQALSRVLPLFSGKVTLDDLNIHKTSTREVARRLSLLPQGPVAPDGLTVRELVAQGRFPHQTLLRQWTKEDAEAVERALCQVQLEDLAERSVSTLSGGQRQRAWIAMVLAQETPILLLDEPTAFLDLKVQVDLLAMLRRIAQVETRTIIVVLHDLNVAAGFADRMVMLKDGKIRADGNVETVFTASNLQEVFDLHASILTDPLSGRPVCVPHSASIPVEVR